jgi:hypothetical protein
MLVPLHLTSSCIKYTTPRAFVICRHLPPHLCLEFIFGGRLDLTSLFRALLVMAALASPEIKSTCAARHALSCVFQGGI